MQKTKQNNKTFELKNLHYFPKMTPHTLSFRTCTWQEGGSTSP